MKILIIAVIYLVIAHENDYFPFVKKKSVTTTLPSRTLNDYSLEELREAYLKKLKKETNLSPELMKLEKEFTLVIQKIDQLVHIEYPKAVWSFHHKNVGASIVLNSKVQIDIVTYDGELERRTVLIRDHMAYDLETVCNETTDYGKRSPSKEFFAEKTTKKETVPVKKETATDEEPKAEEIDTDAAYLKQWIEENFEYLEELNAQALKKEENFILIPKDKYKEGTAQHICSWLVEKSGYENSSISKDGIVATLYSEN